MVSIWFLEDLDNIHDYIIIKIYHNIYYANNIWIYAAFLQFVVLSSRTLSASSLTDF
jgi:hypothetical protein